MQHLWMIQLDWDESIPQDLQTQWEIYENQLNNATLQIPRWLVFPDSSVLLSELLNKILSIFPTTSESIYC